MVTAWAILVDCFSACASDEDAEGHEADQKDQPELLDVISHLEHNQHQWPQFFMHGKAAKQPEVEEKKAEAVVEPWLVPHRKACNPQMP